MSEPVLDGDVLERWQRRPLDFIAEVLRDPKTGRPFKLFPEQRRFFEHCWKRRRDGRLKYPEQCFGAIKKTGKTSIAAMHGLTTVVVFGGPYAEAYTISNDFEQSQARVFTEMRKIVEASPLLRREARITADRITFSTGAFVQALGSDATSAAGGHPTFVSCDELWGFVSERSRRLFDELVTVPTVPVSVRLTTTHAGYENESQLLEEMYRRGMALPEVAPGLHAGDSFLFFWSHEPLAPWQTQSWLDEMRRLTRPVQYLRQFENRFVTSENPFIAVEAWDACVDADLSPVLVDRSLPVWVGIDASVKHDSTAIVAVTWDRAAQKVRLVTHRIFQPTAKESLDFEATIEAYLLDLRRRFHVVKALFDPYQMQAVSQRLVRAGLVIEEFAQSSPNLTAASQNLFDLIAGKNLALYADANMRLAASRAVAVETGRGWRIGKEKQSHKVDVIVALGMACHACVQGQATAPLVFDRDFLLRVATMTPRRPLFAHRRNYHPGLLR